MRAFMRLEARIHRTEDHEPRIDTDEAATIDSVLSASHGWGSWSDFMPLGTGLVLNPCLSVSICGFLSYPHHAVFRTSLKVPWASMDCTYSEPIPANVLPNRKGPILDRGQSVLM